MCVSLQYLSPLLCSDPTNSEVKKAQPAGSTEGVTSSSLPTPAYQSAWANANPGQRTMADIVKMGRPLHQKKNVAVPRSTETQESGSKAPLKDEWPSIQKQVVSYPTSSSLLKPAAESEVPVDQFSEPQHLNETPLDDVPVASPPASVSNRNLLDDDDDDAARDSSEYEDENNKVEPHAFEENRGESSILCFESFFLFVHVLDVCFHYVQVKMFLHLLQLVLSN